ncbi:unannotated protein [freshwater metagenome]|uniref:Unannotated protein n=1 Tax=freshwater metagenome TaxID=449393 RepID=A0A6J7UX81_9ZZZZ
MLDRKFHKTLCIQILLVWVAIHLAVSIGPEGMPPPLAPSRIDLCQGHLVPLHAGAGGCVAGGATAGAGAGEGAEAGAGCGGAALGAEGAPAEGAPAGGVAGEPPRVPAPTGAGEPDLTPPEEVVG